MEIKELDVVALTDSLPDQGLDAGAVGTIVHIFHKPNIAYEVEFIDDDGATIAMATLTPDQFRMVKSV
jgi:hypothetical protein